MVRACPATWRAWNAKWPAIAAPGRVGAHPGQFEDVRVWIGLEINDDLDAASRIELHRQVELVSADERGRQDTNSIVISVERGVGPFAKGLPRLVFFRSEAG